MRLKTSSVRVFLPRAAGEVAAAQRLTEGAHSILACSTREESPLRRLRRHLPRKRWRRSAALAAVFSLLIVAPAHAVEPDEKLADPALEARARAISRDIRCVVCQSENIDDSNAPLARDLRLLVRERLRAGDSDEKVVEFLVERYGDYVLLKPRLKSNTVVLWAAPAIAAAAGALALVLVLRKKLAEEAAD